MEPRYNEPLSNEVLGMMNDFHYPIIENYMKKNLDITKPRYWEQILSVPGPFVKSRFHCTCIPFVVGSLFCSDMFFSGYSGFPLSSKTDISKFQFDQESGRRRTTLWMCYLQIIVYYFILFFFVYMYCSQRVTKLINFLGSPHTMTVIIWRFRIIAEGRA